VYNTTKRVNFEGNTDGIMVTERFNPERLKSVRKEIRYPNEWQWRRRIDKVEQEAFTQAAWEILWTLEESYLNGNVGTETINKVYTMVHQMLVDKNILDTHRDMELPNF
jgi:hypothetical protein